MLAFLPRLANLGTFSLWLDEVIETEQASGNLRHLVSALREDAVHPPLEGLLSWLLLHAGASEATRRLLPILLGVSTVVLLASWTGRRFGQRAGLAVGAVAALSPVGVHYSQELRPYSLALCLMVAALVLLDRLLDGPAELTPGERIGLERSTNKVPGTFVAADEEPGTFEGRSQIGGSVGKVPGTFGMGEGRMAVAVGVGAFLAVVGCFYSLYLSALVMVPLGWMTLEGAVGRLEEDPLAAGRRRRARRLVVVSPLLLVGLGIAYLPWVPTVLALRGQRIQRAPGLWTWGGAFERFEDLTVGGGGPVGWWAGGLALAMVGLGVAAALRRPSGRVAVAGFLAGTVGVEILLAAGHHWSSLRYDVVGWPFLMILLGLGLASLGGPLDRSAETWHRRLDRSKGTWHRWAAGAGLAVIGVAQVAGIFQYYLGREDWRRVAEAVAAVRRPAEPAFALNQSTRICLLYYLDQLAGRSAEAEDPPWFASIDGSAEKLAELWPADRCALLVTQSWGRQGKIVHLAREFPELAGYPATFARLFLLTPQGRGDLFASGRRAFGPPAAGAPTCDRTLPPLLATERAEERFGALRPALEWLGFPPGLRPGTLPH